MPRRRHSSAGEPNRALDVALAHNDLPMTMAAARDLPSVGLDRAAQILVLMSKERSPLYRKAAARWLSRYAAEVQGATPTRLSEVADALAELEHADVAAAQRLLAAVRT